jgi:glycosyltransferase involved in cell wall biosynthesis
MYSDNTTISNGKRAFVISPQLWGKMMISKHHYAVEFAKMGFDVFFINPPKENKLFSPINIEISQTDFDRLWIVNHNLIFSYYFKFHIPWLHHLLIYFQRFLLIKKLGKPDLILSFDLTNNFPFRGLKCKKIFFAADEPKRRQNFVSAMGADLIVSVSRHILDLYDTFYPTCPKILINHGLSTDFLNIPKSLSKKYLGINIGLSGNFLFNDIDYNTLCQIICENQNIYFHFYGVYKKEESNIGYDDSSEIMETLSKLKSKPNVYFHGILSKIDLAIELNQMDAFLICYSPEKGQSSGSNSHKILEYLSTGKTIISSNFSFYENLDLFSMNSKRQSNEGLSELFKASINNLEMLNNTEMQTLRINYARKFTYNLNTHFLLEKVGYYSKLIY